MRPAYIRGTIYALLCASGLAALVAFVALHPSRTCAGPGVPSPAVFLDASPWLVVHPGGSLRACYAGRCETVTATRQPVQLLQVDGLYGTRQRLTVSINGSRARRLVDEKVALKRITTHGPCGSIDYWGLNARVAADGTVTALGWSGSYLQPATPLPAS